jgi:hypothetical protein
MIGKMALSTAAIALGLLGGALPALAQYDYELYGGPHQTWCDVNPDCNGWNRRLHSPAYRSNAYELVAPQDQPLIPKHRPAHKHSHEASKH